MKSTIPILYAILLLPDPALAAGDTQETAWWVWLIALGMVSFAIGILGVMTGVGGGVLFVPIVGSFFPFHIDFVRGAGLLIALGGALAASPKLLQQNLASIRLALPSAFIASGFAIIGAYLGLLLSAHNPAWIHGGLGLMVLMVALLLITSKQSLHPPQGPHDRGIELFELRGTYLEGKEAKQVDWHASRSLKGLSAFVLVGLMAGVFGIGAGWANVPIFNLLMGVPLRVALGTSKFLLSITDTTAGWIYINQGAILPIMAVPALLGTMLGSKVGVKLFPLIRPETLRWVLIILLIVTGMRSLLKSMGI